MNEELAQAAKAVRDPSTYPAMTYLWVFGLAVWGGIVRIVREVQLGGKSWQHILGIVLAEIAISGFAGVNTFFLCESLHMDRLYTAVMTSVASYLGGKALVVFESLFYSRFGSKP